VNWQQFNWLDVLLALILVVSVVGSFTRGFARSAISLIGVVLGIFFGLWFYGVAGGFLLPYVSHRAFANVAGFFLIFFGFILLGSLAAWGLAKLVDWAGLTPLDRVLGGAFGLARGALICVAIVLALSAFTPNPPPEPVVRSRIAPYTMMAANFLASASPREVRDGFQATYERAAEIWAKALDGKLPRLPAQEI
jgi:membrane protein required for colicin V production